MEDGFGNKIHIVEEYEGGKLVRKTANGIEIPLTALEKELPIFVQQRIVMSREQFENIYGKDLLSH